MLKQRLFYLEALYLCIYLHINFYTAQAEENEPAAELQLPKYFRADEGKISMREKKRLPNPLLDERGGAMALWHALPALLTLSGFDPVLKKPLLAQFALNAAIFSNVAM